MVYIDVMLVQDPLDFNLILGHDYVYVMGALVSSLFHVMCFPHEGRIMIIDKISFVGPNLAPNQLASINGPFSVTGVFKTIRSVDIRCNTLKSSFYVFLS